MTNFIQPTWTLSTQRGATQESLYKKLPGTQVTNFDAFGRQKANTFEYKVIYPNGKRGGQTGFSNIRPTTITEAQNQLTGQRLYQQTANPDPRVDNMEPNAYALKNMDIQKTSFNNPYVATVAILAFLGFVAFVSIRSK